MAFLKNKRQKTHQDLISAIDIGSNKVCCAIARIDLTLMDDGEREILRLLGVGQQLSKGLKNGKIVNLEALEDSILNAVYTAEQMAGETIGDVYVNLPSHAIESHTAEISIPIIGQAIDETHIRRLIAQGQSTQVGEGHQVVHSLPVCYSIDQAGDIRDPRGLFGDRLSVALHLISAPRSLIRSLSSCIGRCHLDVAGFVATPYASGLATLVDDEKELGATVIDMGAGHTVMASFLNGHMIHLDAVPIGGSHITSDIARGLSTPIAQAERLKTLYGTVVAASSDEREMISVQPLGEQGGMHLQQVPKATLTHIVRARAEEVLEITWKRLREKGIDRLVDQRIILTGGTSQLPGLRELASVTWGRRVRIGQPQNITGISDIARNPMFSTCAGLLHFGWQDASTMMLHSAHHTGSNNFFQRVTGWIRDNI